MNQLEAAVVDLADFLEDHRIPYMVFGGLAALQWGRPRLTEDVDIKVVVERSGWQGFIESVRSKFVTLSNEPLAFLEQTRVLPVSTPRGIRVDLVMAELPYEIDAVARSVEVACGGRAVHMCTAEDLVIHKIISSRPRDREDVEHVIVRQGPRLDRSYLDRMVHEISTGLGEPDIELFYRQCLSRAGLSRPTPLEPPPHG